MDTAFRPRKYIPSEHAFTANDKSYYYTVMQSPISLYKCCRYVHNDHRFKLQGTKYLKFLDLSVLAQPLLTTFDAMLVFCDKKAKSTGRVKSFKWIHHRCYVQHCSPSHPGRWSRARATTPANPRCTFCCRNHKRPVQPHPMGLQAACSTSPANSSRHPAPLLPWHRFGLTTLLSHLSCKASPLVR